MTAINFPDSPSDGDTHVVGGVTYTYNNAETKWKTTINSNAFLPLSGGTVSGNILMGGEIQHDGDTDTNIGFDTDTILFDTAGSERFRVGSAGQLGIGGATYGTDGQVLTSTGASSAPAWEDLPAGVTFLTGQSVNGDSSVIFTGIPTTANLIFIGISEVSQTADGAGQMQVRFGNGSIVSSTGPYRFSVSYGTNTYDIDNGDQWSLIHSAFTGNNSIFNGNVIMTRDDNADVWTGSWTLSDRGGGNQTNVGGGYYSGSSGLIDRVQIRSQTSSYDGGNIVVGYA